MVPKLFLFLYDLLWHFDLPLFHAFNIHILQECFNSPYGGKYFPDYCEVLPESESYIALRDAAKENKVYLVGGSIPEKEGDNLYNTSLVFSPEGELLTKFRKIHLFDIDVPGKIYFKESDTLSPGNVLATFDTPFCKIGIIICYDIRFPELSQILALDHGCKMIVVPAAFNMTTGPAHWELLQRSRALDNQIYVSTISPARDTEASYIAWGHSTIVNPWGEVIAKADEKETIVYSEIDIDFLEEVRDQIPVTKQRRNDVYTLELKK